MKRTSKRIALLLLPLLILTLGFKTLPPVTIYCNGDLVESDQPPIIENSRTFVPIRVIAEYLGADVSYDATNRMVFIQKDDMMIGMEVGETVMWITTEKVGTMVTLDVPVFIRGDRTMLPVRAVSEIFGMDVGWDGKTRTVSISDRTSRPEKYVNKYNAGQEVVERLKMMDLIDDEFCHTFVDERQLPAEYGGECGYFVTIRQDHPLDENMTEWEGHFFINERGTVFMKYDPVTDGYTSLVAVG